MKRLEDFLLRNQFVEIQGFSSAKKFSHIESNTEISVFDSMENLGFKNPEEILEFRREFLHQRNSKNHFILWKDIFSKNPDLIENTLLTRLGNIQKIHARDLMVLPVDESFAQIFLEKYHILGFTSGKSYQALVFPSHRKFRFSGETLDYQGFPVVGLMVWGKKLKLKQAGLEDKISQEIVRFATLPNYLIRGAWSKLIQHQKEKEFLEDIMTYVDIEWNDAKGLLNMGFKVDQITQPLFFTFKNGQRSRVEDFNQAKFFNLGNYKLRWNG